MTLCRPLPSDSNESHAAFRTHSQITQPGSGAHPASYSVSNGVIYSAEVKNEWGHTSTHPICLHNMDSDTLTILHLICKIYALWTQTFNTLAFIWFCLLIIQKSYVFLCLKTQCGQIKPDKAELPTVLTFTRDGYNRSNPHTVPITPWKNLFVHKD